MPRWQWMRDGSVTVESRFNPELARALSRMGHQIRMDLNTASFGRGQMIVRLDNGVLWEAQNPGPIQISHAGRSAGQSRNSFPVPLDAF